MPQTMSVAELLAQKTQRHGGAKKGVQATELAKLSLAFAEYHPWAQIQTVEAGVLWLPLPPNIANGRWHWQLRDNLKRAYLNQCDTLLAQGLLPRPGERLLRAEMSAILYQNQFNDQDNALARLKWSLDWMVKAGYLVDDNPDCLNWLGVPKQEKSGKTPPRVRLEIREWL